MNDILQRVSAARDIASAPEKPSEWWRKKVEREAVTLHLPSEDIRGSPEQTESRDGDNCYGISLVRNPGEIASGRKCQFISFRQESVRFK